MKSYPNPFISTTTLEFELEHAGNVRISIVNQFGVIIYENVLAGQKGKNLKAWDPGTLPAGVYVCRILSGNQIATGKIVKQ